jgi:hypothetical protein
MTVENKNAGDEGKATVSSVDSQAETLERDVKWRAKYSAKAEEAENLKKQAEAEKNDLQAKIDNTVKQSQAMQKRVIEAELKAQAVTAGLQDLDFLKMIDVSTLKISEDGGIEGLEKAISDFKASKPALFAAEKKSSSSKNEKLPNDNEKENAFDAFKVTDEEYRAKKSEMFGVY